MSENKVSLKGSDDIFKWLTSWLKTPEERKFYTAQAEEKLASAEKAKSDTLTNFLKKVAETKSLELVTLRQTIEMYKDVGHSEAEIRAFFDRELEHILECYDALSILKDLLKNGVILDTKIRQIEPPSKPKDTETE